VLRSAPIRAQPAWRWKQRPAAATRPWRLLSRPAGSAAAETAIRHDRAGRWSAPTGTAVLCRSPELSARPCEAMMRDPATWLQTRGGCTTSAGCVDDMPAFSRPRRSRGFSERRDHCQTSSRPGTWRRPRTRRSYGQIRKPAIAVSRSRNGVWCRSSRRTWRRPQADQRAV
jgi:hypothetical protein